MSTFNPDQALARWIELWEKRHEEFDQLPDVERKSRPWSLRVLCHC